MRSDSGLTYCLSIVVDIINTKIIICGLSTVEAVRAIRFWILNDDIVFLDMGKRTVFVFTEEGIAACDVKFFVNDGGVIYKKSFAYSGIARDF